MTRNKFGEKNFFIVFFSSLETTQCAIVPRTDVALDMKKTTDKKLNSASLGQNPDPRFCLLFLIFQTEFLKTNKIELFQKFGFNELDFILQQKMILSLIQIMYKKYHEQNSIYCPVRFYLFSYTWLVKIMCRCKLGNNQIRKV